MSLYQKILGLLISILLASCGGGAGVAEPPDSIEPESCSVEGKNKYVYEQMHDRYFWYEHTASVDYTNYSSPENLLEAIKYSVRDKWSHLKDKANYEQYSEGKYVGHGYSAIRADNKLVVRYVYKNSPAEQAGLARGVEIAAINGLTIAEIDARNLWGSILGANTVGITNTLTFIKDQQTQTASIAKAVITIKSVFAETIINNGDKTIGYLTFNQFIAPGETELNTSFARFKQAGVNELVLDLRYNSGGRLSVANHLASLIGGTKVAGKTSSTLRHNKRYSSEDWSYTFDTLSNALDLERVYVLTTQRTCSASEAVINALSPFLDVYVVGNNSCGKPAGMYSRSFCDKYLFMIEFEVENTHGEGQYYTGIPAYCSASDDLNHTLGSTTEPLLAEALHLMQYDSCSTTATTRRTLRRTPQFKELFTTGLAYEIGAQ